MIDRFFGIFVGFVLALNIFSPFNAFGSDHADSSLAIENVNLDITDLFVFKNDNDNLVFIVNVNAHEPEQVEKHELFDDMGRYTIFIDTTGDATAELEINIFFSDANSRYVFFVGKMAVSGEFGKVSESNDIKAFAGFKDDPAFIDFKAYANFFDSFCTKDGGYSGKGLRCENTGEPENFFSRFNVGALAVEIPISLLTEKDDQTIRVWAKSFKRVSDE